MGIILSWNKEPIKARCIGPRHLLPSFLFHFIYACARISISNLYAAETRFGSNEGATSMVKLASLLRVISAIGRRFKRALKKLFNRACESQTRKAQLEIDRHHRMGRLIWSDDDRRGFN
jgi:hypothetical protein